MKLNKLTRATIKLSELKDGPAHGRMTNDRMARVAAVAKACKEFDDKPLDDWVDSFMRDLHREKELRLWEGIAEAYRRLTERFQLSPSRKRQLGNALIGATLGNTIEVDGVSRKAIETALSRSIESCRFRSDEFLFTKLRSTNTLRTTIRPLAFETQELYDAYFQLIERFPEWGPVNDEATEPGTNLCIAVHDEYPEILGMAFEAPEPLEAF